MSKEWLNDGGAAFYTSDAGLRGVPVIVMDRDDGTIQYSRVHNNTATKLYLDIPLGTNPDQFDTYILAGNPVALVTVDFHMGHPQVEKSIQYMTFEYERGNKRNAYVYLVADPQRMDDELIPWQFVGALPFTGRGQYRMPVEVSNGTGRVFRMKVVAINPTEDLVITHVTFDYTLHGDWQ
jgi:hypothetical protein